MNELRNLLKEFDAGICSWRWSRYRRTRGVIPGGGDSLGDAQIQISWPLWIFWMPRDTGALLSEFYLYSSSDIKDQEGEASATQQSEVCSYRHPSRDVDGAGMAVGNSSFSKHYCRSSEARRRSGKEAEACGTSRRPFPIFKCEPASARCYQLFAQPWKLVDVTVMEANGSFWFCELSKRIHSQRAFRTLKGNTPGSSWEPVAQRSRSDPALSWFSKCWADKTGRCPKVSLKDLDFYADTQGSIVL